MNQEEVKTLQSKLTIWTSIRDVKEIKETLFIYPQIANISIEQFDKLEAQWHNYMARLETEFNNEKRKEFILSKLRERIIKLDAKEKETLKQYEQQRIDNIPFKERKRLMGKVEMIKKVKSEALEVGKKIKEAELLKLNWINPLLDRVKIRKIGFEKFFKRYWELSI